MDIWMTLRLERQTWRTPWSGAARPLVTWALFAGPATPNPDDQVCLGEFDHQGDWIDSPPDPPSFD